MEMDSVRLGSTGLRVSEFCLGTAMFGREMGDHLAATPEESHAILDAFADAGGNFIDTANTYADGRSEEIIGEWLNERDREEFVIASKAYWNRISPLNENLSRPALRTELEGTLDRLDTSYLDIYYIHRWDDDTPIAETLSTLDDFVHEGKVNYLGISTAAAWKLTKALWTSDVEGLERFEVAQPKFNAAYREDVQSYLDVTVDQTLAVVPYSPLEGGFLTGKYERDQDAPEGSRGAISEWDGFEKRQWAVLDTVKAVAEECDTDPAVVALRWLADHNRVTTPILGARTREQIEENLQAVTCTLTDNQRDRISDAYFEARQRE
ncbi:aryl-alcohol dehydrogenase [Haladaptatus sp. R4]|nr:aryl-alcohol dehydrogenase [Haladaptatus sp. R4]